MKNRIFGLIVCSMVEYPNLWYPNVLYSKDILGAHKTGLSNINHTRGPKTQFFKFCGSLLYLMLGFSSLVYPMNIRYSILDFGSLVYGSPFVGYTKGLQNRFTAQMVY